MKKSKRIWIVPNNDLEAKTIIELLQKNGEDYIVTGQAWGASWDKLEPEIVEEIEKAKEAGVEIYGVELQGNIEGVKNVDHHTYGEDDRSNPKSSIEQVADVLNVDLTLDERFVAANDKGYIPAMEKLGEELGIEKEDLEEIIANIRMRDRKMQGVTIEQEAQSQEAVEKLGNLEEKRDIIMSLPHSKTSTITDRLYGKYDNLLILSGDGETNFYGSSEIIKELNEKFPGGWSGGQLDQGSGFWGGYADQNEIKQVVSKLLEKTRAEEIRNKKEKEEVKAFWLKKYSKDKIGTIAKLSQAMQHDSWLKEWKRVHGDAPRVKPITKKVNGEKVKVGESDIAVPWSKLHKFFREGNEYGDVETVKFLKDRIEEGDISTLSKTELRELSERENVKWSDGKHSLNPFQGYLYQFIDPNTFTLIPPLGDKEYGDFYPSGMYRVMNMDMDRIERRIIELGQIIGLSEEELKEELDEETERIIEERIENQKSFEELGIPKEFNDAQMAFQRFYTTRLLQKILETRKDSKYYDFVNFDITSITTEEELKELDKKLMEIMRTPEVEEAYEKLKGNAKFEKEFYASLRREVEIEIKKDSDRIENAHKVFVALETGDIDELLENPETAKLAKEVYEEEKRKGLEEFDD